MYYAICEGIPTSNGPPWRFFKFKTLKSMKSCKAVDEYAIVYNGEAPRQLEEFVSLQDLTAIWRSFGLEPKKFASHTHAANQIHELTRRKAVFYNSSKENQMPTSAEVITLDAPAAAKAETQTRPRFNKDAKIICIMEEPPIRVGTNRYRNMQIVMSCGTVGEALEQLRLLDKAPGGGVDIKIAINVGAIMLQE